MFRSKTIEESKNDYIEFVELCKNIKANDLDFIKTYSKYLSKDGDVPQVYSGNKEIFENLANFINQNKITNSQIAEYICENFQERNAKSLSGNNLIPLERFFNSLF